MSIKKVLLIVLLSLACSISYGEENLKTGYTSSSIIAELANKYFKEWVVEEPYSLVPNYISPFNIGVKKS